MIVHNLNPVLIDLGFFQIKWYSIAYILGILLGWFYASIIIKNNNNITTINRINLEDLIIYLIFGIILGGRLGYVIFYDPSYYIQNPSEICPEAIRKAMPKTNSQKGTNKYGKLTPRWLQNGI